jgi:AraC family transcriptional regulator
MEHAMDPVRTRAEALLLLGVSTPLPPRSAPPSERPRVIQDLWRSFLPRAGEIPNRRGAERYAVIEHDVLQTSATPILRAMIAVDSFATAPAWCERFTVEPGRYAVFEHKGPPKDLGKTVARIHADWTPRIAGLFQRDLEIMAFPAGYDPTAPDASFEYWLPLPG